MAVSCSVVGMIVKRHVVTSHPSLDIYAYRCIHVNLVKGKCAISNLLTLHQIPIPAVYLFLQIYVSPAKFLRVLHGTEWCVFVEVSSSEHFIGAPGRQTGNHRISRTTKKTK